MAKYKKRSDGRYQANIQIGIDPDTGKRKFAPTIYAYSIPDLESKKSEIRDQFNKGIYADDKRMTVGVWAKKWFETEKASCGIRTKEMYETAVFSHIIPSIGDIRLKELKKSDIKKMLNERMGHRRTCEQIRMTIRQMLFAAIDDHLLYKHVGLNIKLAPAVKNKKRPLSDIEKKALKRMATHEDVASDEDNEKKIIPFTDKENLFVYILLYCGLRRGEILALSRSDIDLKSEIISINNVVTFDHGRPVLKSIPKTDAGIRDLPIPNELKSLLIPYLKNLGGLYLFEMERKPGLMSKSSYDKFWSHIVNKINLAAGGTNVLKAIHGLTAHVFRHNYATMLYYAGVDAIEAQKLLGHSDIRLTMNIYTHLDKNKGTAKEKLNNFVAL